MVVPQKRGVPSPASCLEYEHYDFERPAPAPATLSVRDLEVQQQLNDMIPQSPIPAISVQPARPRQTSGVLDSGHAIDTIQSRLPAESSDPFDMSKLLAQYLFHIDARMVVVITGGASGVGLMIAKTLYAAGARIIYLLGNNQDELDEAEMITDTDKDPIFRVFNCDITSENSLVAAARQVQDDVGHVELFIANAGASFVEPGPLSMSPTDFTRHFFQTGRSQDRYNDTLKVNVGGTFYSIAAFLPLLEASAVLRAGQSAEHKNPKPHILITSSAGAFSRDSITTLPAYGASKAAVMHMMKSLSTYSLKNDWKIRVNALVPGMIRTPLTASLPFMQGQNGKTAEEEGGVHKSICPHERVVREEELAGAVLWVCGRAGEAVDGAAVLVEGGKLSVVPGTY